MTFSISPRYKVPEPDALGCPMLTALLAPQEAGCRVIGEWVWPISRAVVVKLSSESVQQKLTVSHKTRHLCYLKFSGNHI